jgi:hypothetical protein
MSKLPYLVAEVNAAMEVYLSGRTGQQYNRTTFILCDDCAELASKLFLLTDSLAWSDTKGNGHFKRFKEVTAEVRSIFQAKRSAEHAVADALLKRIDSRRERRNEFFQSTNLLDLNFHARDCVEALVDLFDYGKLLFPSDWDRAVAAAGNMETCEAVLRIDRKAYGDPSILPKMNALLQKQPRLGEKPTRKGCEVAHHPEDVHLRLAIRNGNKELRDKLRALL